MTVSTWVVEPRDTLVVRDGRPARVDTPMTCLPFPPPASVAGLVRSEIGFDAERIFTGVPAALRRVEVAGPWLVSLGDDRVEVLGPAPADARWVVPADALGRGQAGQGQATRVPAVRVRCAARAWGDDIGSDLRDGLLPVLPVDDTMPSGKPPEDAPGFWRWGGARGLANWLFAPPMAREAFDRSGLPDELGPRRLVEELRTHVSLDAETRTARYGALFSTVGLRLVERGADGRLRRYGVAFACRSDAFAAKAGQRPVMLGGERRLSRLAPCPEGWPTPDESQWRALGGARRLRVMLLTPGLFEAGYRPSEDRLQALLGPGARLVGAAVDRPTIVSGFDFERRAEKAVRRAAPAGSVYWVDLPDALDRASLERAWMGSVCDVEQDRLDGFGRVLLGVG